jgi:HEAT repeat protein
MIAALKDSHVNVRKAAARGLHELGDPQALTALAEAHRIEKDEDTLYSLGAAIKAIEPAFQKPF